MSARLVLGRHAQDRPSPIERRPVEVTLGGIVRRSNEVNDPLRLIDASDANHVERPWRQQAYLPGGAADRVKVLPPIALAQPEEALPVLNPRPFPDHVHPSLVALGQQHLGGAVPGVASDNLVQVLQAIELLEDHQLGVHGPFHFRKVVISRIGAWPKPSRLPPAGLDDTHADGGVGLANLGVGIRRDLGIKRASVVDELELAHRGGVKLPVSDALPVRAPAKPIPQVELLFVNPVGCAVDEGV